MHQSIKRFGMEGEVGDDADFARLRALYETYTLREMREAGYIPVLGMGPFWATEFNAEKESYSFKLSMHGVKVGRRIALTIEGITVDGRMMPRSTPPTKSKPSSKPAE